MVANSNTISTADPWLGRIYEGWADFFGCPADLFTHPGSTILIEEKNRGTGNVYLWHIGKHAVAEVDPDVFDQVSAVEAADRTLRLEDLQRFFGTDRVVLDHSETIYYLHPGHFRPATLPAPYQVRPLQAADEAGLSQLQAACEAEEVDDAWIQIDQPFVVGCFHGAQLVAVASISNTWKKLTDIGVLTHPAYRRLGLGKGVVSRVCEREIALNQVAQYRSILKLTGSHRLALSLGFTKHFEVTSLQIL